MTTEYGVFRQRLSVAECPQPMRSVSWSFGIFFWSLVWHNLVTYRSGDADSEKRRSIRAQCIGLQSPEFSDNNFESISKISVGISLKELGGQRLGQSWGVWRTEDPQRGSGAEPRWGSGGEAPRSSKKHDINFVLRITLIGAHIPFLFLIYHYTCN